MSSVRSLDIQLQLLAHSSPKIAGRAQYVVDYGATSFEPAAFQWPELQFGHLAMLWNKNPEHLHCLLR